MNQMTERMNLVDGAGAALAKTAAVAERGKAHGTYHATLVGPREEVRGAYVALRDLSWELQRSRVKRFVFAPLILAIEAIMRTMEEVKWADSFPNVVTTVGGNEMLDKYLAGSTYTAAIVMGLKGTGSAVAGDTQASHAAWSEVGGANAPAFTGNRPTPSFSAASAKTKSTSSAVNFAFTSGGTVAGCFINQGGSATKDNTTGVLVSAGDFTGGSKTVANGDQLNVTYSLGV